MAEWAGRMGVVPVSVDPDDASLVAPRRPAGRGQWLGVEHTISLPDSPALICRRGVVVRANPPAARLTGREQPGMLVGLPLHHLLVEVGSEAELITLDGGTVPVRSVRWTIPGTDLLAVFLVDVSDLDAARVALRRERARAAAVDRIARIGSWEIDAVTGAVRCSAGHAEVLGLERRVGRGASGLPHPVLGAVHPGDQNRVNQAFGEYLETGKPLDLEYRVIGADGAVRVIGAKAEALHDQWDRPVRYTGCVWDTGQRHGDAWDEARDREGLIESQRIARIASFTWDWSTGAFEYSPALTEMVAGRVAECSDPLQLAHPDDLPDLMRKVRDLVADPQDRTLECEFRGGGDAGNRYLCRIRVQRGEGDTPRVVGTVQDVTEARALQHALREQCTRLAHAERAANIGTWEWEPHSDLVVCSDMLRELYGLGDDLSTAPVAAPLAGDPDAGPGGAETAERPVWAQTYQGHLSLVHPEDRDRVDRLWRAAVADQSAVECEYRVVRPDGTLRTVRCHAAAAADSAGRARLIGTAQDVTEQRAAQTRIERSSQRFADLLAIAPVGIGIFDDHDRLIDANDALCRLLGYDLEGLRGVSFTQLTHPDERADQASTRRTHEASGCKSYTVPQRMLLRADGEPVYCELHVSVSVQDDGQRFVLVVFSDITERRRVAEALRHQATHDELTGLPNRAAVKATLTELLAIPGRDVAVLFCDINNFKRINDSLGHDAGDELLVALARRLEDGLPEQCSAARLSGDVYVVICSDVAAQGGLRRLVNSVSGLLRTAVPVHGQMVRVSAAIGVAVPDSSTSSPEDLLRFADAALYQAKRQGTGHVAMANAALRASADRQVELECQLREALLHDALQLHYQPVVGPDGSVLTAEALIRWPHPERGLLTPEVLLPVAEQGDLMRELDRWVLRTALRESRDWVTPDGRPVAVAVNIAGLVPGDPDFLSTVATAVAEAEVPWDRVVLELVETALVALPSRNRRAMAELVQRGVRFAVDDFGTGYSSLARLKELPAQIVKVDRRFVSGVGVDPSDFAVARAVVDMARAMGRSCIAEGVETPTQFQVLRELGVDAYQGWLFSRPLQQHEFRALLGLGSLPTPR